MIKIPHLETDITQACQLSCVGCNHSVPLWRHAKGGPRSTTPEQVRKDLFHLTQFLHADRWGALGGEPLLHHQLVDILHVAQESMIADKIEVWTNGLLLPRQKPEFWEAFDILVLSIYPGKHDDASLEWIREKCYVTGVELVEKDERLHPNFRAMLEAVPTGPEETKKKFAGCFFRHFSRVANFGFFFTCCCSPHLPYLALGQPYGADGIAIEKLTEEKLRAFLTRTQPLEVCAICAGRDTAKPLVWHEQKDPVKWMAASKGLNV